MLTVAGAAVVPAIPKPPNPDAEEAVAPVVGAEAFRPKPPKAGGAAAEEDGAVAVPKPVKAGVAEEVDIPAPNAVGAVPVLPKPPKPPVEARLVAAAGVPPKGATVAVGAPKPLNVDPPAEEAAGVVPKPKPRKKTNT